MNALYQPRHSRPHRPRTGTDIGTGIGAGQYGEAPGTAASPFEDQVFHRLLQNRIVFLGSVVEDTIANAICAKLLLLASDDPSAEIHLYINSPGGSVSAGMAIYDTMQYIANDVATVALGFAGSMGQFLLSSGAPGKRFALPHSRVMMHQPSGGIGGTATDIAIQAEQLLFTKRLIQERIAEHTGQPVERIEADSDRDRWFTAEEARDYGLVDRVIARVDQVTPDANSRAAGGGDSRVALR
ncbi:ATP-dependent Clp protease proteolytic subunit [Frankia sp. Mgl5]|uniref:ATP-dependent Clp protease proteolytic subunit n=1 Tax=Frankia sp. Mgl5 TaxID=2933793 RepID=UPI00200C3F8D|nr:ATP-dependent Clp protease proteolytic subunit [Frankia sp. Mgl5]MCK9928333.1 ATP-dependent Clp protease proteolytic subunit [Frankia sp. Mgl5]